MGRPRAIRPAEIVIGPSIAYVPLSRGLYALIDSGDAEQIGRYNWFAHARNGKYYAATNQRIEGKRKQRTLSLHSFLVPAAEEVDHRNRMTLDNRRVNLRSATGQQNSWNHSPRKRKNLYKGIRKHGNKWASVIAFNGRPKYLGLFSTPEEAALAYDAAALEIRGEFSVLNFPDRGNA